MSARDKVVALVPDLRAELAQVEADIATLTEQRKLLKALLDHIEPQAQNGRGSKYKGKKPGTEAVQRVAEFVRSRAEELGHFSGNDLITHPDFHLSSPSTILPILRVLHTQGVLTLVAQGRGGQKIYRVIG